MKVMKQLVITAAAVALWSDPSGTVYCCGPGNVRDCDDTFVPHC